MDEGFLWFPIRSKQILNLIFTFEFEGKLRDWAFTKVRVKKESFTNGFYEIIVNCKKSIKKPWNLNKIHTKVHVETMFKSLKDYAKILSTTETRRTCGKWNEFLLSQSSLSSLSHRNISQEQCTWKHVHAARRKIETVVQSSCSLSSGRFVSENDPMKMHYFQKFKWSFEEINFVADLENLAEIGKLKEAQLVSGKRRNDAVIKSIKKVLSTEIYKVLTLIIWLIKYVRVI